MAHKIQSHKEKRVAIIGGGISGIACMWGLRDTAYEIHLFEAESRLGGHADTKIFKGNGIEVPVDTGFIAMNKETYPQFNAFLDHLKVETVPTDMSFAISAKDGRLEWGSASILAFLGSLTNLLSFWWLRLIFDIIRFNFFARDILNETSNSLYTPSSTQGFIDHDKHNLDNICKPKLESIGDYLHRRRYSGQFIDYFIIPMVAAPWCIDPYEFSNNFPAATLIDFMCQTQLLDTMLHRLDWHTIINGSKAYVDAFQMSLGLHQRVRLNSPVQHIHRRDDPRVDVELRDGAVETFDHVVLAVHANQALRLLGNSATDAERKTLRCFHTTKNTCILHSDESLLPHRHSARASWNCLVANAACRSPTGSPQAPEPASQISITFDMNRLQRITVPPDPSSPGRVLVTMNPTREPLSSTQQGRFIYEHPLFSADSVRANRRLPFINGVQEVSFAGAWMGYGFHEDGFRSGMAVAERLGGGWKRDSNPVPRNPPCVNTLSTTSWLINHVIRAILCCIQAAIESLEDFF